MDPAKLKVVELRSQLSQRGLDTKGNKAVLVERLRKALEEETENKPEQTVPESIENVDDTALKESSKKSVQPPRTPSRSSRSSSVTPTKINTRSTPKHATTPVSGKQSTPSKAQNVEKEREPLTTIPERIPEEHVATERDQKTPPPEKDHDEEEEEEDGESKLTPAEEKVQTSTDESKEELTEEQKEKEEEDNLLKDDSSEDMDMPLQEFPEADLSLDESSEQPVQQSEKSEDNEEKANEEEQNETEMEKTEEPVNVKSSSENVERTDENNQNEEVQKDQDVQPEEEDIQDTDCDVEMKETIDESKEDVTETEKNSAEEQAASVCDNQKVPEAAHSEQEESNEEEKVVTEKDDQRSSDTKEVTEDTCNNDVSVSNQDVEMVEVKPEENTKEDGKDWNMERATENRKRKRSSSPAEELPKSPVSSPASENEPEIDDSTVVLSWYDSDLNLLIEKNDLLSATPMHSDGFCYIWAGARASYGYTSGKIYYEAKIIDNCSINIQDEEYSHVLRVGWSTTHTSMQLGEDKLSYGYSASGKKCTENKFEDYGEPFSKDDIIGCYADMSLEDDIVLFYTLNGKNLGTAFSVSKKELGDKALFPHVLSKNCTFACNFGQEKPWSEEIVEGYTAVGNVDLKDRIQGPRRPEKKEDCEVLMMCGLPAAGKTVWATKYAAQYPEKMYNILGISTLVDKMKNMGQPRKQNYHGRWEVLIEKCTRTLNRLLEMACSRRRNYILDQTNVYPSAQRRRMKNFSGFQRKAIVVVPTNEEFKSRTSKHEAIDGKAVPDSVVMEMKANFSAPEVGESFDEVNWVELNKEEGRKLIEKYNKEGKEAGYGQQQASKRPRFDRNEGHKDNRESRNSRDSRDTRDNRDSRDSRDNRDHRDHRDRRNNYSNRNRNSIWRGSNNVWTDRSIRGGHMRQHGGGYGPPRNWRGRGMQIPPPHRGGDRRGGSNDRRGGNDRNRSVSRQGGGWGPASGYQGSQQSGWNQQSNWSNSSQSQGWGQGWSQQSYGQGSYGQCNYNQQGYGNGNWNQQYYNQYWDPQQSSGQTTAAGGQAVSKQ